MTFLRHIENEKGTVALAQQFASFLCANNSPLFIAMDGTLGAGKSCFTRACIQAYFERPQLSVPSPSYTLIQEYNFCETLIPIRHYDLYRLEDPEELYDLDWDDSLNTSICFVEWSNNAEPYMPNNFVKVALQNANQQNDQGRDISVSFYGSARGLEQECEKFLIRAGEDE